jgi:hypothetical protein
MPWNILKIRVKGESTVKCTWLIRANHGGASSSFVPRERKAGKNFDHDEFSYRDKYRAIV